MIASLVHHKAEELRRLGDRKTDARFSFLKALGIFFVVIGHVGPAVGLFAEDWFPQGPMKIPLFVFASGVFFASSADEKPFAFILRRAKRLLLPYFLWNIFYGVLCEILRLTGAIGFGMPLDATSIFLTPWVNGHQFGFNAAAWFLPALFLASSLFALLRFLLKKLRILNEWALAAALFVLAWGAIRFSQEGYAHGAWLILIRTVYFLPFLQLGKLLKTSLSDVKIPPVAFFAGVFLLAAANRFFLGETSAVTVWCEFTGSPAGHLIGVTLAVLFWYKVADLLSPALEKMPALIFVGENTFSVMLHHALVIFLMNAVLLGLYKAGAVSVFDEAAFRSSIWYADPLFGTKFYLCYVAAAILVPCLLRMGWNKGVLRLDQKLNPRPEADL